MSRTALSRALGGPSSPPELITVVGGDLTLEFEPKNRKKKKEKDRRFELAYDEPY